MIVLRRWYWIVGAFLKKYAVVITVSVIVGMILVLNSSKLIPLIPTSNTQYIGRIGAYTLEDLPIDIQEEISAGLTRIDDDGQVSLDQAISLKVSEDATEYTVQISPDAQFTDSSPLVVTDLNLNMPDVQATTVDEKTVKFTLAEPFAPFPALLSQPILKRITTQGLFPQTQVIGTKDFKITDVTTQNQIITSLTLSSSTETRKYFFYPTETEAVTAFKLGKIDSIEMLSQPQLQDWPNVSIQENKMSDRYLALFYNTKDPNLQDKQFRQMLTYATPKTEDDTRVISPIAKSSWVYNPQVKTYDYNLDTAAEIKSKLGQAQSAPMEITTTPAYYDTANQIAQSWQQLGIQTTVKVVPFPDTNDYQVLLIGQKIPKYPDQYALWHSTQSTNITNYQNAKIDKLLEDGRQETDTDLRKEAYQDFQRFIVEDAPAAFLRQLSVYTLSRV